MALLRSQIPILTFLTIFSLFVFKYDSKWFKTSRPTTIYCVSMAISTQIFFWYISTLTYTSMASKFDKESALTAFVHSLESISLGLGMFPILLNAFLNRKNQVNLLNKTLELDDKISSLKYQLNQKQTYKKFQMGAIASIVLTCSFYTTLIILLEAYIYPGRHELLSQEALILIIHILFSIAFNLLNIFMTLLVKIINKMFQTLNLNLEQELANLEPNLRKVVEILEIHKEHRKLFNLFSKSFGIAIVGLFLEHVALMTCELFLDYLTVKNFDNFGEKEILIIYDIINIIWCAPLVISFGVLDNECEKVVLEAEKNDFLLKQIDIEGINKNMFKSMVKIHKKSL